MEDGHLQARESLRNPEAKRKAWNGSLHHSLRGNQPTSTLRNSWPLGPSGRKHLGAPRQRC